jgi:penicillin-insensitive murein endopeptidase
VKRVLSIAALGVSGCLGTPTPLAPGIGGSVGVPHLGVQTNAVELPVRGAGYVRYRPQGRHYWGNPRLVRAVENAARAVATARPGGAPLVIGDLSAERGGEIPRHNSHRTGRDVDLLWLVTTPDGAPAHNPGFVRIGADGLAAIPESGDYVRLDVERQWLLLRELLMSTEIHVQWMFCSREIEALLIDYARARGEPPELVWRAETVLMQPGDSLPHDDHIHLRIACSPEEAVMGCEGGGPYWEWLPPLPRLRAGEDWIYEMARDDPFVDEGASVDDAAAAGDAAREPSG